MALSLHPFGINRFANNRTYSFLFFIFLHDTLDRDEAIDEFSWYEGRSKDGRMIAFDESDGDGTGLPIKAK